MKYLVFSTIGNENFGDESMATNYIEKNLKWEKVDIVSYYKNADNFLKCNNIINPFLDIKFNTRKERILTYLKVLICPNLLCKKIESNIDVKKYEKFVMCGGGNLNSIYLGTIINIYLICYLFNKNKIRIEFRPQSIGPFNGFKGIFAKYLMREILKFSDKFLVRETESYKIAKNLINTDKVKLQIDDAWGLDSICIKDERINKIINKKTKKLAISIRPWNKKRQYIENIKKLVFIAIENNYEIYFIPIAIGGKKNYIDNSFIKEHLKSEKGIYFLEDYLDLKKVRAGNIKWIISKMDRCIGLSYHFNVYSKDLNKKSIALYSDEYYYIKNYGLYSLLEDSKSVIEIENLNEKLINEFLSD